MEATRDNASRLGMMFRERPGHGGAASLFTSRRHRQFVEGLLTEEGYQANYVLFQPSRLFARTVGDGVLRLNHALYGFRDLAADHVMFLDRDRLEAYYGELDHCVEKVRDRLAALVAYCGKGYDGEFTEALESGASLMPEATDRLREAEEEAAGQPGTQPDGSTEAPAAGPDNPDAFEAPRETAEEQGVLTELGRREGWVAFRPCPFYGRFLGDVAYTLNDALLRVERRTSFFIASGSGEVLRQYYEALEKELTALRGDLEGVMAFCGRKAA